MNTRKKTYNHTTHYACREVIEDSAGQNFMGCCCTGHKCLPHDTPNTIEEVLHAVGLMYTTEEAVMKARADIKALIEQEKKKAEQDRIEKSKSFCGCPMCYHHASAFELGVEDNE